LPKTLEYLAAQKSLHSIQWEVILVNNNSTDSTKELAVNIWKSFREPAHLLIVDEIRPGLSFAREKGISVARYDIILFCDDDNWLKEDYIATVWHNFQKHQYLGALGGWSSAVFEGKQPDWFDRFKGNFAVGEPLPRSGYLKNVNDYIYGAGMALSKQAINDLKLKGFRQILSDRKGSALSSGGDVELIYALKLIGYNVMYDESLHFYHYMPIARMQWEYLKKLRQSMYWSNFVLGIYTDTLKQKPIDIVWMFKRLLKSVQYIYTHNKQLKHADKYKAEFLKNKLETKVLFIKYAWFYYKTRLALNKLKND
jgi:glycosyltransferase involved in cell wall biosynthesis